MRGAATRLAAAYAALADQLRRLIAWTATPVRGALIAPMLKPTSLRAFLTLHVPGLADNPDRLQLFVEKGGVLCRATETLSYENRYTLQLVLTPYAGDIDELFVPLLAWIASNEPLLLERASAGGQQPFVYTAEILDGDEVDLSIDLELTERVLVTARPDGTGYLAEPLPEPVYDDRFAGTGAALLRRLFGDADVLVGDADVLAETTDPDWLAAHPRP